MNTLATNTLIGLKPSIMKNAYSLLWYKVKGTVQIRDLDEQGTRNFLAQKLNPDCGTELSPAANSNPASPAFGAISSSTFKLR